MTLRPPRLKRFGLALLAVLQLGIPPIVGLADATLAARAFASAPRMHVEDFGTRDAVASHPDDCALCQLLRLSAAPSAPASMAAAAGTPARVAGADRHGVASVASLGLPDTRAPPTAQ